MKFCIFVSNSLHECLKPVPTEMYSLAVTERETNDAKIPTNPFEVLCKLGLSGSR